MSLPEIPVVLYELDEDTARLPLAWLLLIDDANARKETVLLDILLPLPHLPAQDMLWLAIDLNLSNSIPLLIRCGADLNERRQNIWDDASAFTPLMHGVSCNNLEAVASFIDQVDANLMMPNGWCALRLVDANTTPELLDLLLQHGANPTLTPHGARVLNITTLTADQRTILRKYHPDLVPA